MYGRITKFVTLICLAGGLFFSCSRQKEPVPSPDPVPEPDPLPTVSVTLSGTQQMTWGSALPLQITVQPTSLLPAFEEENLPGMLSVERAYGHSDEPIDVELQEVRLVQKGEALRFEAVLADKCTRGTYSQDVRVVFTFDGEKAGSPAFHVVSRSYEGLGTGLPLVIIDTPESAPITSKETWMEGAKVLIFEADMRLNYQGVSEVKGRGNSTWTQFPKKPYALRLDKKAEILGMAKHKRWCLLANWMDRTLIRNDVAFEIGHRSGLAWTPSGRFVELVLNGKHLGNYYLCEQVKVDKKRVNISEEGGFLMECDAWFDEPFKFRSATHDVPWQFKDPDEVTDAQFQFVQKWVNDMEEALYDDTRFAAHEYLEYLDAASFADWWIVNELSQNSEVNQPKSAYVYMDAGGKLTAGPVWDFDWGTFIPKEKYNYVSMGPKYYINRLFQDPAFRSVIKERWNLCRDQLATIPAYIDAVAATLVASDALNIAMWPINRTTNQDEQLSYSEAVARLKKAYQEKYDWMNTNINSF